MAAKRRKRGDWVNVMKSRNLVPRITERGRGLTNLPGMNETGSAAYRRLRDKLK